jgi:hypothetical protein
MLLTGVPGSGKTYTALAIAAVFAELDGGLPFVIDTERRSASLYVNRFKHEEYGTEVEGVFVPGLVAPYSSERYLAAMREGAEDNPVVVVDSLSHGWNGPGGFLDLNQKIADRKYRGNTYAAWKDIPYDGFIDDMLQTNAHLICTARSKIDWVVEDNAQGKKAPKKVGMAPKYREGIDFEFDLACEMNLDHKLIVSKTRFEEIADEVIEKPGAEFAQRVYNLLRGDSETMATDAQRAELTLLAETEGATEAIRNSILDKLAGQLTEEEAAKGIAKAKQILGVK